MRAGRKADTMFILMPTAAKVPLRMTRFGSAYQIGFRPTYLPALAIHLPVGLQSQTEKLSMATGRL